jgi:hypothetical protein
VAGHLPRITRAWLDFAILTPHRMLMRGGTLIEHRIKVHGLPIRPVQPRLI